MRTVEPSVFREAMSRLGAAVHVITTDGPAGKTGYHNMGACYEVLNIVEPPRAYSTLTR